MPVRLRLQRHGRKRKPFYWIVAADSRAKRDGKFLEKVGTYNPTKVPAEINLDGDAALKWLHNGAQPTDTVRQILRYKGVMFKKHLLRGVRKGALSQEDADKQWAAFMEKRDAQVATATANKSKSDSDAKAATLKAEKAIADARLNARTPQVVEEAPAEAAPEAVEEEAAPQTIDDVAAQADQDNNA